MTSDHENDHSRHVSDPQHRHDDLRRRLATPTVPASNCSCSGAPVQADPAVTAGTVRDEPAAAVERCGSPPTSRPGRPGGDAWSDGSGKTYEGQTGVSGETGGAGDEVTGEAV